ncbi:MAG: hypothetical protein ACRCT1_12485 [Microcoleaceae cyanobacterium]
MEMYAHFYGEWSSYWEDYKWQSLNGGHNAIAHFKPLLNGTGTK